MNTNVKTTFALLFTFFIVFGTFLAIIKDKKVKKETDITNEITLKTYDETNDCCQIGMSPEQVLDSLYGWGAPKTVQRFTDSTTGTSELWIYGAGYYLYFKDNKLIAIQESITTPYITITPNYEHLYSR